MEKNIIKINSTGSHAKDAIEAIKSFLRKFNVAIKDGLPVINLLLFWDSTNHYAWRSIGQPDSFGDEFEQDIAKILLETHAKYDAVPIGICQLTFVQKGEKVYLNENTSALLWDDNFEIAEVLNGTVPYFMKEHFGYKLEDVWVPTPKVPSA